MKKLFLPLLLALGINATAQVKIGNNPTVLGSSSILELENATKGLVITRVEKVADIVTPVGGMIVYDLLNTCFRGYEKNAWSPCFSGSPLSAQIAGNATCASSYISQTGCSTVSGATINDDPATISGIEYDFMSATSTVLGVGFGAPTNTQSLVEIGGQCWSKFNHNVKNTVGGNGPGFYAIYFPPSTTYTEGDAEPSDTGEGLLYQYKAVMNGNTTERSQGVCPNGWHVPSDCEWMFLENTATMSVADQQKSNDALGSRGTVGASFTVGSGGNNKTGFTVVFAGFGSPNGGNSLYFTGRGTPGWQNIGEYHSSTLNYGDRYFIRAFFPTSSSSSINRYGYGDTTANSLRCLKD